MSAYSGVRKSVNSLIRKYGITMNLERTFLTESNNPWEEPSKTTLTVPIFGVILEYEAREIDGVNIMTNDKKVLLSSSAKASSVNTRDKLIISGIKYTIVNVNTLAPSGNALLYTLQARII